MTTIGYSKVAVVAFGMLCLAGQAALAGGKPTTRVEAELCRATTQLQQVEAEIIEVQKAAQDANQRYVEAMGMFNATRELRYWRASREAVWDKQRLAARHAELMEQKTALEEKIFKFESASSPTVSTASGHK